MFTEDFAGFFDTADFATAATFDGASTVNGIFLSADQDVLGVAQPHPVFRCAAASVSSPVGKTLVIGSTTYIIRDATDDGTGLTALQLEKQ